MSMSWQELRKEAYQLSVSDRLLLVEAIVRSLRDELETHPTAPTSKSTRLSELLDAPEYVKVQGMPILSVRQLLQLLSENSEESD